MFMSCDIATSYLTRFQYSSVEQSRVEKGLVFAWADLRSH